MPADVRGHFHDTFLAFGEIIMRRMVGIKCLGAQRGEHVHQFGSFGVDRHRPAPHFGDKRTFVSHHAGGDVLGLTVVHFVEHRMQQPFLAADVMQHARFGEVHHSGDALQRRAVVAERAETFDRRVENRASAVDFVVGHNVLPSLLEVIGICNSLYGRSVSFPKMIGVLRIVF